METAQSMNPKEVAAMLGVCERSVWRMFARGELPGYKVGRRIRFARSAVEAHMSGGQ